RDPERRSEGPLVEEEERDEPGERSAAEGERTADEARARERVHAEDRRGDRVRELGRRREAGQEAAGREQGQALSSPALVPEYDVRREDERRREDVREEERGERQDERREAQGDGGRCPIPRLHFVRDVADEQEQDRPRQEHAPEVEQPQLAGDVAG